MLQPFFVTAAQSPNRQSAFRTLVAFHLLVLGGCFFLIRTNALPSPALIGHCALVAGIVEGALLLGWRLTQLPKSRALEFLLASPLPPHRVFLAEMLVGLLRLALVTLSGLPFWLILADEGLLSYADIPFLLFMPFTWGWITGISLTAWAYEPVWFRRWGERFMMLMILVYLVVGVLAGENLKRWLEGLPDDFSQFFLDSFYAFHAYNPFGVIQYVLEEPPGTGLERALALQIAACLVAGVLSVRAAWRMQGHYQDRHYSPAIDPFDKKRKAIGTRPLSWWAVKRVSEYAGKVNLWLAGGFGILYALHTIAGDYWPDWMGRQVFTTFDRFFGIAGVATALTVLAAVPAAFQYGLWDSSTQDRCQRLELLLLSQLDAEDYWLAALAAAWRRGSGYFAVAMLLWVAAAVGERIGPAQALLALTSGVMMWLLYFSLGFRAFSTGMQANNLGLFLTAGLPLLAVALYRSGWPALAGLTPPGCVYLSAMSQDLSLWLPGILGMSLVTLHLHRISVNRCLAELRAWYERYHGKKVMD